MIETNQDKKGNDEERKEENEDACLLKGGEVLAGETKTLEKQAQNHA